MTRAAHSLLDRTDEIFICRKYISYACAGWPTLTGVFSAVVAQSDLSPPGPAEGQGLLISHHAGAVLASVGCVEEGISTIISPWFV